jgi:molecular chaperone GrpE
MKHTPANKIGKTAVADTKITELTADLQRLQAEFINYKRRAEAEKLSAIQTGKEQALIAILPVLDNIERAVAHEPADIKEHQWVKGVSAIAIQLEGQMEAIGLKKIGEVGEEFDPNKHEAVVLEDGEGDTEVVSGIIQTGYMFGEDVIRPAIVKVVRK